MGSLGHPIPVTDPVPQARLLLILSLRWDVGEEHSNIEVLACLILFSLRASLFLLAV